MNYKSVTIWHKENDRFKRILFEKSSVTELVGIEGHAAGERKFSNLLVRAYSLYDCGIKPGDYLCIGYEEGVSPPEDAYIITEVTAFFSASAVLRHYRLKCA